MEEFNQITLGGIKVNRVLSSYDESNNIFVYAWRLPFRCKTDIDTIGKLVITNIDTMANEWVFKIENQGSFIPVSFIKDIDKLIDRIKEKYRELKRAT